MGILSRLNEYITFKGYSMKAFEESVGMSNGSLGTTIKNGQGVRSDKLEKILSAYPELSAEWLLRGTGNMITKDSTTRLASVSNIKQRLIEFIQYKELNISNFEKQCGITEGFITRMSKGVGAERLAKISRRYPELNTEWLLTGSGEMLNESSDSYMIVETRPRIPFKAITGHLHDYYAGDKREECEMKPIVKQFPHYQFTMLISRNVMSPYIDTGDVIACAEIPKITAYGHVYVLDTDGDVLIRRVYVSDVDSNKYKLVAENKNYPDLIIDSKDVKGIYRIVGMLRVEI